MYIYIYLANALTGALKQDTRRGAVEYVKLPGGWVIGDLARLYSYMRDDRRSYLTGAICLLGTNACALLVPWLLKLAVESLQRPAPLHSPAWYGGLIITAAILHGTIRIFSRTAFLHVARRIEYRIRDDLYARLLALDLPFFQQGADR